MKRPALSSLLAAVMSLGLTAEPASGAEDEATLNDVRCLLVFAAVGGSATNNDLRLGAAAGMGYFLGKLKVRTPDLDLQPVVLAEAKKASAGSLRSDGARCGKEMEALSRQATAMGEAVKALGDAQGKSAPP